MYCDKDSRGLYSINDLTIEQMTEIRQALETHQLEPTGDMEEQKPSECSAEIAFKIAKHLETI